MGEDIQEALMTLMLQIKVLQNDIWRAKIMNREVSVFSQGKFTECELMLNQCFDALSDIRRLEAVEQRYDPA